MGLMGLMGRFGDGLGMVWDGLGWFGMVWDSLGWFGMIKTSSAVGAGDINSNKYVF